MCINHHLFAISVTLLAGMLAVCGTPADLQSSDQATSRADLIARLQSPSESEELHSFRIKTEMSFSGQLSSLGDAAGAGSGTMAMRADVQTDPAAVHLTTAFAGDTGSAAPESDQMIVAEDQL